MSTLTAERLLRYGVYSVEQAGIRLHDAFFLYIKQRYSSAVMLAASAQEELGRCSILLDERTEARKTGPRSAEAVRKACKDHLTKLAAGRFGVSIAYDRHSDPELKGKSDEEVRVIVDIDSD